MWTLLNKKDYRQFRGDFSKKRKKNVLTEVKIRQNTKLWNFMICNGTLISVCKSVSQWRHCLKYLHIFVHKIHKDPSFQLLESKTWQNSLNKCTIIITTDYEEQISMSVQTRKKKRKDFTIKWGLVRHWDWLTNHHRYSLCCCFWKFCKITTFC